MQQEEARKESVARTDYWLAVGIVVKVMNKTLQGGDFYKQKGTVEKLVDRYTAHVRLHEAGELLEVSNPDPNPNPDSNPNPGPDPDSNPNPNPP